MEQEKQHRSIAELWDRFQRLANYIETEKTLQSWGTKGSDGLSHDGRNHAKDESELQSLRTELLERCSQSITDGDGDDSTFDIYVENDENPQTFIRSRHGIRFDTPQTARNMSAAYAFWAWELEQRSNEAQKGGGE